MAIDRRIDVPFLNKFNRKSPYIKSESELYASIVEEIGNILSTKLKTREVSTDSPFAYGVRDLQSLEKSDEAINQFKQQCRDTILRFEPRVSDIDILECRFNDLAQTLELEFNCQVPEIGGSFSSKISLAN